MGGVLGWVACAYRDGGACWECLGWSALVCGDDSGWRNSVAGLVNGGLLRCGHGGVHDGAGRAGEGDLGLAVHLGGDAVPGAPGALFGDADQ